MSERTLADDVRRFLGLKPYTESAYTYLDGYFAAECKRKWGEHKWEQEVERARRDARAFQ